jgi:hypothetical protein
MKKLLVVMLMLYPLSALAQTYEWTDDRGTVNFADDLGKVPKKYRKKAKVLGADESVTTETTVVSEPVKAKAKGDTKAEAAPAKKLYGGKDESYWRSEFQTAKGQLQRTESDLADLRGRMGDTSKMTRIEYLSIQNSIKNDEERLKQQQKKLDLLKESADRAGVPADLRKD